MTAGSVFRSSSHLERRVERDLTEATAEFAEQSDHYLLADDSGYCLRRFNAPNAALVDFKAAAAVRRMQQGFEPG